MGKSAKPKNSYPSIFSWLNLERTTQIMKSIPDVNYQKVNEKSQGSLKEQTHLFFAADNLHVCKSLIKHHSHEFPFIFIDPPYNSTKDFLINDYPGEKVALWTQGTSHQKWVRMLYPRLILTRKLLHQSVGVVVFCIDDKELPFARLLMDEVFGEHNFIGNIIWNSYKQIKHHSIFTFNHSYLLFYAYNLSQLKQTIPDFSVTSKKRPSIWQDLPSSFQSKRKLQQILSPYLPQTITNYLNPKPRALLNRLLEIHYPLMEKTSISPKILDLFAGTGSLLLSVNDFNRITGSHIKYFGIQYPVDLLEYDSNYNSKYNSKPNSKNKSKYADKDKIQEFNRFSFPIQTVADIAACRLILENMEDLSLDFDFLTIQPILS